MHDFTPLCKIVTVGYQLNDGTHVHANSPFADRKLSWNAAILVQQRTAGKRVLIEGMMEGPKGRGGVGGGCLPTWWDSCHIQSMIIWHKADTAPNHFSRLRENKMDTVRTHKETGFTCKGRLNIAMWCGPWQSERCSWGIACYQGKDARYDCNWAIQKDIFAAQVSQVSDKMKEGG